jgi:hypothetical protein
MMTYQDFEAVKERALKERAEFEKLWNEKRTIK